jgi:hypothetical protein
MNAPRENHIVGEIHLVALVRGLDFVVALTSLGHAGKGPPENNVVAACIW